MRGDGEKAKIAISFLVDEEVRNRFKPQILRDRIALQMARESEEVFFEETDERLLR